MIPGFATPRRRVPDEVPRRSLSPPRRLIDDADDGGFPSPTPRHFLRRCSGRMKTLDRYILAKTIAPLSACVAIALVALLLERMVRLMDLVVNKGGPFFIILKMLANLIPHYLGIAIPAAFFVGTLLAISRLSGDSELDAIHSMGVGLRRMLMPLMGLAVVLAICSAIIVGLLQPYTRYAYRALVFTVQNTAWDSSLERATFFTGLGDMAVMVDNISDAGHKLYGIFLYQTKSDGSINVMAAEEGQLYRSRITQFRLILNLTNGTSIQSDQNGQHATVVTFGESSIPLDLADGPVVFRQRGVSPSELTLFELWQIRGQPGTGLSRDRIDAEINDRLVRIVSLLFLPLLAIPLGIVSRRTRRSVGLVAGIVLLILYHNVLRFGQSLVETGSLTPLIGQWLPCILFAAMSAWAFQTTSKRPGYNPVIAAMDRVSGLVDGLRRPFAKKGTPV
jgi:lipopolysaccharide export system permease protein